MLDFIMVCGLNVCVLPNFICWNLNPNMIVFRSWGHWEVIRSQVRALITGIIRPQRVSSSLLSCDITSRKQSSPNTKSSSTMILDLPGSITVWNKCLLFINSVHGIFYSSPNGLKQTSSKFKISALHKASLIKLKGKPYWGKYLHRYLTENFYTEILKTLKLTKNTNSPNFETKKIWREIQRRYSNGKLFREIKIELQPMRYYYLTTGMAKVRNWQYQVQTMMWSN